WAQPSTQAATQAQPQTLDLLCSVPVEWCTTLAAAFTKETGVAVRTTQKVSADVLALLTAQRALPRYDLWYAGAGDLHLAAAQSGLTDEYRSPAHDELRKWSSNFA